MSSTNRVLWAAVFAASSFFVMPSDARAQDDWYLRQQRFDQRAHDNGYREGLAAGEQDAYARRPFSVARSDDYREGDDGYVRGEGDVMLYRRFFREGFATGYRDGYDRVARDNRNIAPTPYVAPRYGPTYGPTYPDTAADLSPAAQIGFRDGLDVGRKDARDGETYDPVRSDRFRSADHLYDRRYGTREDFKRDYRAGFEQGYAEGYRVGR